jgi:hypothetical protein
MKFFLFDIFLYFLFFNLAKTSKSIDFSYYHTTPQIETIIQELKKNECKGYMTEVNIKTILRDLSEEESTKYNSLKYYDISKVSLKNQEKQNIFLLSGEHPRELISVEMMLEFIIHLCGNIKNKNTNLLEKFNFRIILDANPLGRQKVEAGEYCRRTNENNVDINRNWDIFWGMENNVYEYFPGKKAFSEIETRFILESAKNYNSTLFLSIHSGIYGLYTPYAYREEEGKFNIDKMNEIIKLIKKKYCPICQRGPPSKSIGYQSSGTCLDYIYENFKVPYTLAWEIYTDEVRHPSILTIVKKRNDNKKKSLPKFKQEEEEEFKKQIRKSSFFSLKEEEKLISKTIKNKLLRETNEFSKINSHIEKSFTEGENEVCVSMFNPLDKESYKFIVSNWREALIELLNFIHFNK